MNCRLAGEALPAADGEIDVCRSQLDPIADPAYTLCRNQSRSTTEEWVENDVAARRGIEDGIGHQRNWLNGGMKHREFPFRVCFSKGVYPWILPNVGPVAAVLTQLNVVAVSCFTAFENEHQFVLAAVERALRW